MSRKGKRRGPEGPPEELVRVKTPNRADGEMYGIIIQMLGFDRVRVRCEDGEIRIGRIPGRMKKRVW
ncbi:MAG: translation initiation factor 1A, partial [Promethearchaeota archaeon]